MNFLENYIKNPYLITPILLLGVVLGIISFKSMPLNLFPDANYPKIAVILVWPGASAGDVEDKVARAVEKELATLDLVRKVKSSSRDEVTAVSVEFEYEKGLDAAEVDVSAALDRIWSSLPTGILPPRIFKISDATVPACTLSVYPASSSHLDLSKVRQIADNELKELLLRVPNIAQVEVFGGYIPEVRIKIDRDRLARYNLSLSDVLASIYSQNLNIPGGLIITEDSQVLIKVSGEVLVKRKLEDLIIAKLDGGEIHLRDIGSVVTTYKERQSFFHGNGRPAIGINILRSEKGHVTDTLVSLKRALPEIKKRFPDLIFEIVDTQENLIKTSISNLVNALRDAIILTVCVIFLFLSRIRMTLLVALSIPFTYFITFFVMKILGLELNIVTLTAVIIAVGLLVDDAVVVTENIDRHIKLGSSPVDASLFGTQEIWLADFAGTITTIVVLLPIVFIGGYVEKILRPLSLVLIISLLTSYVISITLIPFLSSRMLKKGKLNKFEQWLMNLSEKALEPLRAFFVKLFMLAMNKRFVFILLGIFILVLSARQMSIVGRDLMPPMDTGIVKINFETEPNSSIAFTERVVSQMEKIIKNVPGFVRMATVVGSEPQVVSFGSERTPQQGLITVHFVDRFHRKESIWDIEDVLRRKFSMIPGLKYVHVYEFGATPLSSITAPIDVMIGGPDYEILDILAKRVMKRLYQVKGLKTISRNWDKDKKEIFIRFNLEKLKEYELSPVGVASFIKAAFSGEKASILRVPGEDGYPIVVRFSYEGRDSLADLETLKIPTSKGVIPLNEVAHFEGSHTLSVFTRQSLSPVIDVLGYRNTAAITHLQSQVDGLLENLDLPRGYWISQEGEIKPMKEAFGRLKKALIVALILLYFSLVPTFKSFSSPLVIMVAIPLSLIGTVWGLLLVGRHFCMPASMGLILLSGIVVNNSIILIDFIERERKKGLSRNEAIISSIRTRVRPIFMTASSTITGMLPIAAERALGLERLSPLAVVAIGGLIVSTLLTLFYVPVLYTVVDDIKSKLG